MKNIDRFFQFTLLMFCLMACRKPYEPAVIKANSKFLVFEGVINTGVNAVTTISLSRTRNLYDSIPFEPELFAKASIETDGGPSYTLQEQGKGIYTSGTLNLNTSARYRIKINTADGNQYVSDFVTVKQAPVIDEITWEQDPEGVNIFLNTHDPQNNTTYYRWSYSETWEYHAVYDTNLGFRNGQLYFRDSSELTHKCWSNSSSTEILIGTSAKLTEDVISRKLITSIPRNTEKITQRYSILVKQFALTREAFEHWQILEKNKTQRGTIFDSQPAQLTENIHCITNPDEPVIGWLSASSIQEKRIFINNSEVAPWGRGATGVACDVFVVPATDAALYLNDPTAATTHREEGRRWETGPGRGASWRSRSDWSRGTRRCARHWRRWGRRSPGEPAMGPRPPTPTGPRRPPARGSRTRALLDAGTRAVLRRVHHLELGRCVLCDQAARHLAERRAVGSEPDARRQDDARLRARPDVRRQDRHAGADGHHLEAEYPGRRPTHLCGGHGPVDLEPVAVAVAGLAGDRPMRARQEEGLPRGRIAADAHRDHGAVVGRVADQVVRAPRLARHHHQLPARHLQGVLHLERLAEDRGGAAQDGRRRGRRGAGHAGRGGRAGRPACCRDRRDRWRRRARRGRRAVRVAVDADRLAGAGRHAGVRALRAGRRRLRAQGGIGDRRLRDAVALEEAGAGAEPAAGLPRQRALHHHLAVVGDVARDQQIDARPDHAGVGVGECRLLADDRRQVAVEGQHEGLHLLALEGAAEAAGVAGGDVEAGRVEEAMERVDAAVVQEAEAAHLVAEVAVVAGVDGHPDAAAMPNMPTFW